MNALDRVLQTGKATANEIYLAKALDELTEEMEKLKFPQRFKVIQPMFKTPTDNFKESS